MAEYARAAWQFDVFLINCRFCSKASSQRTSTFRFKVYFYQNSALSIASRFW